VKPRTNYSASLFRDAMRADQHHSRYEGRHSRYDARHVARKPSKWKWAAAAAAAAGGIAAVATAAPWSGGSASLTADQRVTATSHSPAFSSAQTNMGKSAADSVNSRADVASKGKSAAPASGPKTAAPASPKAATPHVSLQHSAPAAAKPAVVNPGAAVHAAQKKATPAHSATPQSSQSTQSTQSTQPTTFYDSVEPGAIPAGAKVATYADGPYAQSAASLAGRGTIMWIDVSGGDPNADALDIEPTDATPAVAAAWVDKKLTQDPSSYPILYTSYSEWGSVKADVAQLPSWMATHVKYWIADPTGYPHILPGANATQWYWGKTYDISSAEPGFFS